MNLSCYGETASVVASISGGSDDDIDNDGLVNFGPDGISGTDDDDPDIDGDGVYIGTECVSNCNDDDPDIDNDGLLNETEDRFGGNNYDDSDSSVVIANIQTFSETAPADSDLDGVPNDVEAMLGEDNTTSTFQDLLDTLSSITTTKNVPAMGGIGLLALSLSMLGLGAVRLRKKS